MCETLLKFATSEIYDYYKPVKCDLDSPTKYSVLFVLSVRTAKKHVCCMGSHYSVPTPLNIYCIFIYLFLFYF